MPVGVGSSLAKRAFAGQVDAGCAALATFIVGLYAARYLDSRLLGIYALLFSAFLLANQFSTQLIFTPIEVFSIRLNREDRLTVLRSSFRRGGAVAAVAASLAWLGGISGFGEVASENAIGIGATASLLAFLSPIQDHLRRLLHIAERSWAAAQMSVVQLVATGGAVLFIDRVGAAYVPFGALSIANLLSLLVGISRLPPLRKEISIPPARSLIRTGGWLLTVGINGAAFGYVTAAVMGAVGSLSTLGLYEGARIVSHPLNVAAGGVANVLGPYSTQASEQRNSSLARKWRKRFTLGFSVLAVPYLLIVAIEGRFNPLTSLVPNAYLVNGLVLATSVVFVAQALLAPLVGELLGARLEASLARSSLVASWLSAPLVLTTGITGAFAVPLSIGVSAGIRWLLFRRSLSRFYQKETRTSDFVRQPGL